MIARLVPFAAVAALLGVFTAVLAERARAPYAGAQVEAGHLVFVAPEGPTQRAGLRVGDRWRPDVVSPTPTPRGQLASAGAVHFIAGLGWLIAGLVLLVRRDTPQRRLVFAGAALFGGSLLLHAPHALRDALGPAPPDVGVLAALAVPFLVTAAAAFYVDRRACAAVGLGTLGLAVLTLLMAGPAVATATTLTAAIPLSLLLRTRCADFTCQRQGSWVLAGLTLAAATQVVAAVTGTPAGEAAAAVGSFALPLAFCLALFKVQLLTVERILGGAVVDTALALPPLLLAWRTLDQPGLPPRQRMIAAIAIAGAGVWLAGRARAPLARWIAAVVWPDRAKARRAVESALVTPQDPGDAFVTVGERVAEGFGLAHARLWRLVPGGAQPARGAPVAFPHTGHLVAVVEHFGAPAFVSDFEPALLTAGEREALRDVELVVPCQDGLTNALIGWLAVGRRADGRPLDAARYRMLADLAPRLAHALAPFALAADEAARTGDLARALAAARAAAVASLAHTVEARLGPESEALRVDLAVIELPLSVVRVALVPWLEQTGALIERLLGGGVVEVVGRPGEALFIDPDALRGAILLLALEAGAALVEWSGERRLTLSVDDAGPAFTIELRDSGPGRRLTFDQAWAGPAGDWTRRVDRLAARAIVAAHDGTLTLAAPPTGGMQARIALPTARLARG